MSTDHLAEQAREMTEHEDHDALVWDEQADELPTRDEIARRMGRRDLSAELEALNHEATLRAALETVRELLVEKRRRKARLAAEIRQLVYQEDVTARAVAVFDRAAAKRAETESELAQFADDVEDGADE